MSDEDDDLDQRLTAVNQRMKEGQEKAKKAEQDSNAKAKEEQQRLADLSSKWYNLTLDFTGVVASVNEKLTEVKLSFSDRQDDDYQAVGPALHRATVTVSKRTFGTESRVRGERSKRVLNVELRNDGRVNLSISTRNIAYDVKIDDLDRRKIKEILTEFVEKSAR